MSMRKLAFTPFDGSQAGEVRRLFMEYPHKDFQLRSMRISKEVMANYLETTLWSAGTQSICLRDDGNLVGLISLQSLPWMSEHFGLKMYAVSHLLAGSGGPLVRARLLRYVIEELQEVDFLDCRIAVDDVYAAQALETAGFRYVGTEAYLGRELDWEEPFDLPADIEIAECSPADRSEVLEIVQDTHVHNRFVTDPLIGSELARSLYRKLVHNCFKQTQFNALVARSRGEVQGFIISKINEAFCQVAGMKTGSLDFIGVKPDNRSQGLGACLNRVALQRLALQGVRYVGVRTLASNYPALRITFKTGFVVTSTSLHFHRWIQRPKIEGPYVRF
jgi:ribosomal protein S18 acetylase RimI-like enzyme